MASNPANAVVNIYEYTNNFERNLSGQGYLGSAFIYQDMEGVLYIYTRYLIPIHADKDFLNLI